MTAQHAGQPLGHSGRQDGARALRAFLTVDALASGLLGVLLATLSAAVLADLFGLPSTLLVPAGLFLVAFAGWLRLLATRPVVRRAAVSVTIVINASWALASIAVVVAGWFSPTALGVAFVLVQAAAVAAFTAMQYAGLRRAGLQRAGLQQAGPQPVGRGAASGGKAG